MIELNQAEQKAIDGIIAAENEGLLSEEESESLRWRIAADICLNRRGTLSKEEGRSLSDQLCSLLNLNKADMRNIYENIIIFLVHTGFYRPHSFDLMKYDALKDIVRQGGGPIINNESTVSIEEYGTEIDLAINIVWFESAESRRGGQRYFFYGNLLLQGTYFRLNIYAPEDFSKARIDIKNTIQKGDYPGNYRYREGLRIINPESLFVFLKKNINSKRYSKHFRSYELMAQDDYGEISNVSFYVSRVEDRSPYYCTLYGYGDAFISGEKIPCRKIAVSKDLCTVLDLIC